MSSTTIKVVEFDFDGTLRDGLKEKVFAFQKASEVTSRILGLGELKEFTEETMRTWAGVPVGEIAVNVWPEAAKQSANYRSVYEQAWDDVYNHYNIEVRGKDADEVKTPFTDAEKASIINDMPPSPWFEGTQDLIKDLDGKGVFVGILSNPPSISALKGEVATGGVLGNVKDVFTGSPFGIGKPHPDALLHGMAAAWAEAHDEVAAKNLKTATDNVDLDAHYDALKDITTAMILSDYDWKMDVLMIGDGAPDLRVATAARTVVNSLGLGSQVTVNSLGLGYGWQYPKDLVKLNPSAWAKTPTHMAEQINTWLDTGCFKAVPDYPALKDPKAILPSNAI